MTNEDLQQRIEELTSWIESLQDSCNCPDHGWIGELAQLRTLKQIAELSLETENDRVKIRDTVISNLNYIKYFVEQSMEIKFEGEIK